VYFDKVYQTYNKQNVFSITNLYIDLYYIPHLLFHIEKNIIFIQYNDYIEYFYYLCDVEKEEPAGS